MSDLPAIPVLPPYVPPPKRQVPLTVVEVDGRQVQVKTQHAAAIRAGANCLSCPLYAHDGIGPVFGDVVPNAKGALVGEAPGKRELEAGRVFVGPSGKILDDCIEDAGGKRGDLTITNALLCCQPGGGNLSDYLKRLKFEHKLAMDRHEAALEAGRPSTPPPPLVLPTDACFPRLARDLDTSASRTLIPVGAEGLRAVARYTGTAYGSARVAPGTPKLYSIKKQHGSPLPLPDGRLIFPSLHPAFAMHGNTTFAPIIAHDLTRAIQTAYAGGKIEWTEPEYILEPSFQTASYVLDLFLRHKARVTVDIETDSANVLTADIRCIGLGATIDGLEIVIVLPWNRAGGRYWSAFEQEQLAALLRRVHDECPLAGQNLSFDTAILLRHGLMTDRRKSWFDTMVAHHDTRQSELQHDLGFIIARKFVVPRWKEDADAKNVDNVTDLDRERYCGKDVLGEMRLVPVLAQEVVNDGMVDAFLTDTDLAPCARDMGLLGIPINEEIRRDFYYKLDVSARRHLDNLRRLTGKADFNPNSPRQVARFLFVEQQLTPPFDAAGEDWSKRNDEENEDAILLAGEEEDDAAELERASTSELALITLLDKGVSQLVRDFVDELLRYRAMRKIIGTYLGYRYDEEENFVHDVWRERGIITEHDYEHGGVVHRLVVVHGKWGIHRIPSGRWNCVNPPLQVFPERVVYDVEAYQRTDGAEGLINTRQMFEAPPGHVFVGADLAKVEWKLYVFQAGDKFGLKADDDGLDDHSWNFASMMGRTPEEVATWYAELEKPNRTEVEDRNRKHNRNIAKRVAYLCEYGGQEEKMYKTMATERTPDGRPSFPGLTPGMVSFWYRNFHTSHPEMQSWQQNCIEAQREYGYVASLIDRRKRYFLGGADPTAVPNHTIQASAADITNRAMKRVYRECPPFGWSPWSGPVLQIHDYIGLIVPEARADEAANLLATSMTYELRGRKITNEVKVAGWRDKKGRPARPSWDRT